MLWIRRFLLRLQTLFHRHRSARRLDDEVQFHLEQQIAENIAAGMSREEARYAAMRAFGNPTFLIEEARDAWGWTALESIGKDFRYALRSLRGSPLFTLTVILSLALGIGANTAIFTLLHASLWRPLPVDDAREIFHLMRASSEGDFAGEFSYSYPLFQQLSKVAAPCGEVFATETISPRKFGLDRVRTEWIAGEAVSDNFFSMLNVGPIVGRVLEPQDDNVLGGNHVAVLSYAFWRRRFQSDASILGKTILYDETPYTVVGVARPGFTGIEPEVSVDVWVPATAAAVDRGWKPSPGLNWLRLLVRLHPGVDPAWTQAMLEAAFREHVTETLLPTASSRFKEMLAAQHVTLLAARSGLATTGRKYEKPLLILLAVVAMVLLISCANIANLLLARNVARRQEIMVRLALGASRARVACQLFAESLILSASGATFGIFLSMWGTRLLLFLLPQTPLPLALDLRPDFAVFGFTASIAIATAILFGLGPVVCASGEKVDLTLKGGQRIIRSPWSGRLLLAGQFALSLPLLVGAGLFLETLHNLKSTDVGFRPEDVVTFDLSYPKGTSEKRLRQAYSEIKERLESHPGVVVAGYAWPGVYGDGGWSNGIEVEGHPVAQGQDNEVGAIAVGPGFFEAVGLNLLQGRYLNSLDQQEKPPAVVVNERFAQYYFGEVSAIGKHIKLDGQSQAREIVGVVRDARHYGIRERIWPMMYLPTWQGGSFFVRSNLNPQLLSGIIRAEVAAGDKILQLDKIRPLESTIDDMVSEEHLTAVLSSVFAALACLLAAIGLYGVVAYSVSRRTNEFGVRLALGAQRSDIRTLVLRQTLVVILGGIAIGIGSALVMVRLISAAISGMLYGTKPMDQALFAGAAVFLAAIALVAAFIPARRASRVDPMVALRYE